MIVLLLDLVAIAAYSGHLGCLQSLRIGTAQHCSEPALFFVSCFWPQTELLLNCSHFSTHSRQAFQLGCHFGRTFFGAFTGLVRRAKSTHRRKVYREQPLEIAIIMKIHMDERPWCEHNFPIHLPHPFIRNAL